MQDHTDLRTKEGFTEHLGLSHRVCRQGRHPTASSRHISRGPQSLELATCTRSMAESQTPGPDIFLPPPPDPETEAGQPTAPEASSEPAQSHHLCRMPATCDCNRVSHCKHGTGSHRAGSHISPWHPPRTSAISGDPQWALPAGTCVAVCGCRGAHIFSQACVTATRGAVWDPRSWWGEGGSVDPPRAELVASEGRLTQQCTLHQSL